MLQKVKKAVEFSSNALVGISVFLLAVLMFLGAADVIGRYVFDSPIVGTMELSEVMMAGIVLLGWAYTQKMGGHVKVELLVSHYPPRAKAIASFVTLFISLLLFGAITRQSLLLALKHLSEHRVFPTLHYPTGPFYFFVPVGSFFLCLIIIMQLLQLVSEMRKVE